MNLSSAYTSSVQMESLDSLSLNKSSDHIKYVNLRDIIFVHANSAVDQDNFYSYFYSKTVLQKTLH